MNAPLFFENAGDERGTPQDFFDTLNAEFHFDLDAAANSRNHKCDLWYGEGGIEFDALDADWAGMTTFLNPPYSAAGPFVAKARAEADKGATVVVLIPARTDTRYWHQYVWDKERHAFRPGVECRFIQGRLQFELDVPNDLRGWIKSQHTVAMKEVADQDTQAKELALAVYLKSMVIATGLPKMSIERILLDYENDDLLEGAPFPSCVIVFRKAD